MTSIFSANRHHQRGVSLIELMIAMVLGLLVVGAILQLFLGTRATQMSNEALARVQESGRFALEMFKPEARGVNIRGICAGRINVTNHLRDTCDQTVDTLFDTSHAVIGWEYDGTGRGETFTAPASLDPAGVAASNWTSVTSSGVSLDLPAALEDHVVPGSDVVVLRNLNRLNITLSHVKNDTQIEANAGGDTIKDGSIVLVANCGSGGDMFQQAKRQNVGANPTKPRMNCSAGAPGNIPPGQSDWGTQHTDTSSVYTISTTAYYVGMNQTTGEPGLYRVDTTNYPDLDLMVYEELVSGVETMQALYGYSLPAEQGGDGQTVDFWLPADEVPNWEFVIGVRISMLVRSPENMSGEPVQRTFDLVSTQFTHTEDGRLRQPFFTSISLRNQQIVM